ncbi:hypothetical protein THAOC_34447, partial [Thalassiosira oceanica]
LLQPENAHQSSSMTVEGKFVEGMKRSIWNLFDMWADADASYFAPWSEHQALKQAFRKISRAVLCSLPLSVEEEAFGFSGLRRFSASELAYLSTSETFNVVSASRPVSDEERRTETPMRTMCCLQVSAGTVATALSRADNSTRELALAS